MLLLSLIYFIKEQVKEEIAYNPTETQLYHDANNLFHNENSSIFFNTNFQQELYPSASISQPLYNSQILSSNSISYIPPSINTMQPLHIPPASNQLLYNPYIYQQPIYSSDALPTELQSSQLPNTPFFSPTFSSINSIPNNNSYNLP